ncbi:MAG: hypothetical protein Q8P24_00900 [Desulfobacterales bacterium]|nr:hypothetical protein [Desulfobacterales bacterium]
MMNASKAAPAPRTPQIKEVAGVEELLPNARLIVKRQHRTHLDGLNLKPGTRVLMIVDSTNDRLVQDAFEIAIREAGGTVEKIMLHGYPELTDPVKLVDAMFSRNWWPDWVWQAVKKADCIMQGAMLKTPHTPNLPVDTRTGIHFVEMEWTAELLASHYNSFPGELRDAIDKSAWDNYAFARNVELIDLEGTELRVTLDKEDWDENIARVKRRVPLPYMPGHLHIPVAFKKGEGTLAASSLTFGGIVPRVKMTVEGGRVTEVMGGGAYGDTLRRSFEEYKDLTSPRNPKPGVNWVSSFGICTHPKGRRAAFMDRLTGSARVHGHAFGHRRSGVIHTSIGAGIIDNTYKIIRHIDQYFTTLTADGKKIIDNGHMLALDDPEVHKVAEKYGDPKELLAEDWIPAVSGVNAP